jgi:O-methyltransferase
VPFRLLYFSLAMHTEHLLSRYPIVSDQVDKSELQTLLARFEKILTQNVAGDVVEFGCYVGTTSLFLRRLLDTYSSNKELHVYDSFAGLPDKLPQDYSAAGEQFKTGELHASKQTLIKNFKQAGLRLPYIHKGWFDELTASDIPGNIAFAFLDGDYYASIKTSLELISDRLSPGAIVIVDDYQSEALPGARKATDEWANAKGLTLQATHSLAIITIP